MWCVVVLNSLNKTRLSPLLVAFLAASATLSLSNAANGQTAEVPSPEINSTSSDLVPKPPTVKASKVKVAKKAGKQAIAAKPQSASEAPAKKVQGTIAPALRTASDEISPADMLAMPPIFAQATPEQNTPDRIQVRPRGSSPATPPTPTTIPPVPQPTPPTAAPEAAPTAPAETPTPTTPTPPPETPPQTAEPEARVLVAEVAVKGAEGQFQDEVYRVIRTQPGRTTTRSQLQEDINAIFATGFFSNVKAVPEDTPLGVRVTFEVVVNPVLQSVKVEGNRVLPEQVVTDSFGDQYGKVLNLNTLQDGIKKVNKWYQDKGYVLAQVLDSPAVSQDGTVILQVAEGEVESIKVRFINKDGADVDPKSGKPIKGRTRDFIITREFQTKPGDIFNRRMVEQDIQRVFGLGIFEDVRLSLQPSETDPRKVIIVPNVVEKNTGSIFASAGISSASGLFGSVGYQQQNIGGNNQKFSTEVQVGQREILFDFNFTDPWIGGDPYRTSYTVNLFRRQTISVIFDGGKPTVKAPNGDVPIVLRTGGILSFTRPLSKNVFERPEWVASLGLQYQRVVIRDGNRNTIPFDALGNCLSFPNGNTCTGKNDLTSLQFGVVRDRRNDALRPTSGSFLRLGTEQWLPIGEGNILGNRVRGSYSKYIPIQLVKFTKGCRVANPRPSDCPQTFAFNLQAGTVVGDLPPYEAFALGGANSVRGYDEGDLGAVRSFVQGTIEYRFPIISIFSGALFVDGAYDFGSQGLVPGNPGGVRGKPGSGYGYGVGVRVQSPLGPIRVDFGINDQGNTRINFGIGERF